MRLIVAEAILRCGHDALVGNQPSQTWVRVTGIPVLVEPDPQGRPIGGCPNVGVNLKPVSYTHLDVYKRQPHYGRAGAPTSPIFS